MSAPGELAAFFAGLRPEDVPADVLDETRRMLLDTLGCIVSARATEAGPISKQFAAMVGGAGSPAGAAYEHGRLADAMDFNEGCAGAHFGSGCVAAALALAREPGISGKEWLLAIAAGYELAGRIQEAIGPYYTTVDGKVSFARVWGIAAPIVFAAAGAAAKLLRFDERLTTEAWGLAGSNTPIPVGAKWSSSVDLPNTKYCDAGWCTLAGVTAALSARFGSTGITSLLDDEDGLLRMVSATAPAHERLFSGLGDRWCIRDIVYKQWPACGLFEGPIRLLQHLVREHAIAPGTIDRIEVEVGSAILARRFVQPHPRTFASLQFNLPHALAMVLLDVPAGPRWLDLEFAGEPHVASLRERVSIGEHVEPWPLNGRQRPSAVRVHAGGRSYFAEALEPEATKPDIEGKFMSLVGAPHAHRLVDAVMGLDTLRSPLALLEAFEQAEPIG